MAKIELTDVSLSFSVRRTPKTTFKEYLTRALFLESRNPRTQVHALTDINLRAADGERIGVIGHNGAGKSTLLRLLAGVYPPTKGTRVVEGRICSLFDIALGFEPDANGWENIKYRAYLLGESPRSLRKKIDAIAAFTELGDFLDMPVRFYSSGMMVRLAFSISTAVEPEVLLLDEVLAAGDMAFQIKSRERMREMMGQARLMVLVSHDLPAMTALCNRAVWLHHGQVRMEGNPFEVVSAYQRAMSGDNRDPEPDRPPAVEAAVTAA